jgi:hypothetical protein
MNKKLTLLLLFAIPLFCVAQNSLARQYDYDAAGNRILRKTIILPVLAPPTPPDSVITNEELEITNEESGIGDEDVQSATYFVEEVAQVKIKIYPNPTTEKITLEIAGWENLQQGIFKLYALNGQLLQERPVHSGATEISLAGLARGSYILKVQINDRTEDWKIIKQ